MNDVVDGGCSSTKAIVCMQEALRFCDQESVGQLYLNMAAAQVVVVIVVIITIVDDVDVVGAFGNE